jgi:hypothetical protein
MAISRIGEHCSVWTPTWQSLNQTDLPSAGALEIKRRIVSDIHFFSSSPSCHRSIASTNFSNWSALSQSVFSPPNFFHVQIQISRQPPNDFFVDITTATQRLIFVFTKVVKQESTYIPRAAPSMRDAALAQPVPTNNFPSVSRCSSRSGNHGMPKVADKQSPDQV